MSTHLFSGCPICGGTKLNHRSILWPELIDAWEISLAETNYINQQQGSTCSKCNNNVRSMALAQALCTYFDYPDLFDHLLTNPPQHSLLEVNEAGTLHARLKQFPKYSFGSFPQCNLMDLAYPDQSFDLIVHSDTLEHVSCPRTALKESKRVLRPNGATIFTVPIIIGRLSRSRQWLPASYHGAAGQNAQDHMVHTEFGSDLWTMVLDSGFKSCTMVTCLYPAGIAVIARN